MTIFYGLPLVFWVIMMNPGYQSSGSRAQMDKQPTRIVRYGRNEEMDRERLNKCVAVSKYLEKKAQSLQEALDLLQNLPSEISDVLTNDFSDEEVPANNLLECSLDS
ncbi:hypothetical protein TNCV_2304221 [Trichonephila clavipes]|nr:hypothetical protein TNCV_2304221 [Trichonephila clavipes]